MNRKSLLWVIIVTIVAFVAGGMFVYLFSKQQVTIQRPTSLQQSVKIQQSAKTFTYENKSLGFGMNYPSNFVQPVDTDFSCIVTGADNVGHIKTFNLTKGMQLPITMTDYTDKVPPSQHDAFSGVLSYKTDCVGGNNILYFTVIKKDTNFTTLDSYMNSRVAEMNAGNVGSATGGAVSKVVMNVHGQNVPTIKSSDGSAVGNIEVTYFWEKGDYIYTIAQQYQNVDVFPASDDLKPDNYDSEVARYKIGQDTINSFTLIN